MRSSRRQGTPIKSCYCLVSWCVSFDLHALKDVTLPWLLQTPRSTHWIKTRFYRVRGKLLAVFCRPIECQISPCFGHLNRHSRVCTRWLLICCGSWKARRQPTGWTRAQNTRTASRSVCAATRCPMSSTGCPPASTVEACRLAPRTPHCHGHFGEMQIKLPSHQILCGALPLPNDSHCHGAFYVPAC